MNGGTTERWKRLGRWALKGLAAALVCVTLVLLPLGGSSKDSEIELSRYLPRSPHQAYAYSLAQGHLSRPPASDWLAASERSVAAPEDAVLPLDVAGRFDAERAGALGYRFAARGGQRVYISVETAAGAASGAANRSVFVDLFVAGEEGARHLESTPPAPARGDAPAAQRIELAVLEPAEYVLRVQPELGHDGRYNVSIRTAPLLEFPVEGMSTRAILSGFGAERDAGARVHRGVDIFAPRGTLAVAGMDAWVTRVEATSRGGNVVWLQPLFGNMRLYYAHLDSQLVDAGDFVLAGDAVGTVGNTGNARTTPPHLHFGVYVRQRGRRGGARDPYPFLR